MPETSGDDHRTPWYLLAPPAACIAAAIGLTFTPHLREQMLVAANRLWIQAGYLHAVYHGVTLPLPVPHADLDASKAGLHGVIATALALLVALTSVFRMRLTRYLRVGAFLEGPLIAFRKLQSGHVGDYVAWMTVGASVLGAAYVFLLR